MSCKYNNYRVGNLISAEDFEETRGMLFMGRDDGFIHDPQGNYMAMNGVAANFTTIGGTPVDVPFRPVYEIAPYVNKKGKRVTKTSKPRNAWIIYRAIRHAIVKAANPQYTTSQLCKCIGTSSLNTRLTEYSLRYQGRVEHDG